MASVTTTTAQHDRPRLLFLDAYDSFSNNIVALLTTLLDAEVRILEIDNALLHEPDEVWREELGRYDAVVCGPGPGRPGCGGDVGLMRRVWRQETEKEIVPSLGICLGFQSLVTEFGGTVERLGRGLHGRVWKVEPERKRKGEDNDDDDDDVFERGGNGDDGFKATLYHSLGVVKVEENQGEESQGVEGAQGLRPLAWAVGEEGERILMAVQHENKPFWGLQYHPESVCTDGPAHGMLKKWFESARKWNIEHGRVVERDSPPRARQAKRRSLLGDVERVASKQRNKLWGRQKNDLWGSNWMGLEGWATGLTYYSTTFPLHPGATITKLFEALRGNNREHILLDSSNAGEADTETNGNVSGRYSILGVNIDETLKINYQTGDQDAWAFHATETGSLNESVDLDPYGGSVWKFLADFQHTRRIPSKGVEHVPFAGGFMGYITYEMGLHDIGIKVPNWKKRGHTRPDICLAWVVKSLVVDHQAKAVTVQCLARGEEDRAWVDKTRTELEGYTWGVENGGTRNKVARHIIKTPDPEKYEAKVRACQEYIAAGDSYELCLTDETKIFQPLPQKNGSETFPWELYKQLREAQPAPFASFVCLGAMTLVSASPERFLEYKPRPLDARVNCRGATHADGHHDPNNRGCEPFDCTADQDMEWVCTMRPMKGTVRKGPSSTHPNGVYSLAEAKAILYTEKEIAENLMIVDLVRHDLHGVCGAGRVSVPSLMVVEEYRTVWQMVTTVEGVLPTPPSLIHIRRQNSSSGGETDEEEDNAPRDMYTGLDVLTASLPPGSMTGAPKKRSCEILRELEGGRERSLYSGVVGYMDIAGRGDWSVTIRSMFRWADHTTGVADENETWRVGAGGAVTVLSTAEGEREEMFTKLAGPLGVVGRMDGLDENEDEDEIEG